MTVSLLSEDKKTEFLFSINLTCIHCQYPLHEEEIKDIRDLEKGIICTCGICQARINVKMAMSQYVEMEEEENGLSRETEGDNKSPERN